MPYTAKQRAYFHAQASKGKPGMKKLASEADSYARQGREKPPAKKAVAKKATPARKATAKKAVAKKRGKK